MGYRTRSYCTAEQRSDMWDRWQKGENPHSIAKLFDRHHSSIQGIFSRAGGFRPPERARSRLALTLAEREEFSRSIIAGHSIRSIAKSLGRAPSTISREIRRNCGPGSYRANRADEAAWDRAQRVVRIRISFGFESTQLHFRKIQLS